MDYVITKVVDNQTSVTSSKWIDRAIECARVLECLPRLNTHEGKLWDSSLQSKTIEEK